MLTSSFNITENSKRITTPLFKQIAAISYWKNIKPSYLKLQGNSLYVQVMIFNIPWWLANSFGLNSGTNKQQTGSSVCWLCSPQFSTFPLSVSTIYDTSLHEVDINGTTEHTNDMAHVVVDTTWAEARQFSRM